jgi:hypothetical protein
LPSCVGCACWSPSVHPLQMLIRCWRAQWALHYRKESEKALLLKLVGQDLTRVVVYQLGLRGMWCTGRSLTCVVVEHALFHCTPSRNTRTLRQHRSRSSGMPERRNGAWAWGCWWTRWQGSHWTRVPLAPTLSFSVRGTAYVMCPQRGAVDRDGHASEAVPAGGKVDEAAADPGATESRRQVRTVGAVGWPMCIGVGRGNLSRAKRGCSRDLMSCAPPVD